MVRLFRVRAAAFLFGILAVCLPQMFGQSSQSQSPQEPTIRAVSEAVLLDIVVRDKEGRPIENLLRNEIKILENGVEQEILSFNFTGIGKASIRGAEPAGDVVREDVSVDRPDVPQTMSMLNLVTFVFDNLSLNAQNLAKDAAHKFIEEYADETTWMSVFNVSRRLIVLQQFTQDRELLKQAIDEATSQSPIQYYDKSDQILEEMKAQFAAQDRAQSMVGEQGADPGSGGAFAEAKMAEMIVNMLALTQSVEMDTRGRSTLYGLLSLVQGQGALEGRKTLVYFAEGLYVPSNLEALFNTVISEANRKNVSVYAVDARGLMSYGEMDRARNRLQTAVDTSRRQQQGEGRQAVTRAQANLTDEADDISRMNLQMMMNDLSTRTGGFLIANTNDFGPKMEMVSEDISYHYEIAYTPNDVNYDGTFREIEVIIDRPESKDFEVQSRLGYFALPPSGKSPVLPFETPLLAALSAVNLPQDLTLKRALLRFEPRGKRSEHRMIIEMPLSQLQFEEQQVEKEEQYDAAFAVMALIKDEAGEVVEKFSQNYPVRGPIKNLKAVKEGDAVFIRELSLSPGEYSLETIAKDLKSEKLGGLRNSFSVPEMKPGVKMSSVVIVKRTDPLNAPRDPSDPLQFQDLKIVPSTGEPILRVAGNKLVLYMVVYPDSSINELPKMGLEFSMDGNVLGGTQPQLPEKDENGNIPFVWALPIENLGPGDYNVRVAVQQGDTWAEENARFIVQNP